MDSVMTEMMQPGSVTTKAPNSGAPLSAAAETCNLPATETRIM